MTKTEAKRQLAILDKRRKVLESSGLSERVFLLRILQLEKDMGQLLEQIQKEA